MKTLYITKGTSISTHFGRVEYQDWSLKLSLFGNTRHERLSIGFVVNLIRYSFSIQFLKRLNGSE